DAPVRRVTISPDSRWVASFTSTDQSVIVWRIADGLVIYDWHYPQTVGLEFSQDGRYLGICTTTEDGIIRIWNVDEDSMDILVDDAKCSMLNMVFSPDGKYIACPHLRALRIWSALTGDTVLSREIDISICQTTFSPDSRWLALACEDGTVRLWDIRLMSCVASFRAHDTVITSLAFSPYGDILCSGARDGTVHIHRLRAALP
ncbi:WD40 repeat-like protein, partial [Polyporus arcularius HHB13444]